MSLHKQQLTVMEEEGLRAHGLTVGAPSQLSDAFRHGIAWAVKHYSQITVPEGCQLVPIRPTTQMLAACTTSKNERLRQEIMRMAAEDYAAMLSAAPSLTELLTDKETEDGHHPT